MPYSIPKRLAEALDVSGAFDNCFFHSYALHLMANKLELPQNLFTFQSISGVDSPASKLQKRFPSKDSLSLFAEHAHLHPENPVVFPEFMVEKTLILGFLMREWFATKMLDNTTIRDDLLKTALISFNTYKEFIAFMDKDELLLGNEGVLYSANDSFLTYFSARPKAESLSSEEIRFEKYFTVAGGDTNKALTAYWNSEGYENYCKLIATPGVKLAYVDVTPIINTFNQSLTIYNANQSITHNIDGNKDIPTMEVKLNPTEGHYYLLKTEQTTPLLNEYANSFKKYKEDRQEVLATVGNKDLAATQKSSVFVGAICPPGHLAKQPITLLLDKVDSLKAEVREHLETKKQQEIADQERQQRLAQQVKEQQNRELVLKINAQLRQMREAQALEEQQAQERLKEQQAQQLKEQQAQERLKEQQAQQLKEQQAQERLKEQQALQLKEQQAQERLRQQQAEQLKEQQAQERLRQQQEEQLKEQQAQELLRQQQEEQLKEQQAQERLREQQAEQLKEQQAQERLKEQPPEEPLEEKPAPEPVKEQPTQEQGQEKPRTPGVFELAFNEKLTLLTDKMLKFKDKPEHQTTYDALDKLHKALKAEGELYFRSPPTQEKFDAFKDNCEKHIQDARPEVDKHRGWSKIMINLTAFILSAGVGYLLAAGVNMALNKGKFTFFSTDSSLKIDEIEESINKAAPAA